MFALCISAVFCFGSTSAFLGSTLCQPLCGWLLVGSSSSTSSSLSFVFVVLCSHCLRSLSAAGLLLLSAVFEQCCTLLGLPCLSRVSRVRVLGHHVLTCVLCSCASRCSCCLLIVWVSLEHGQGGKRGTTLSVGLLHAAQDEHFTISSFVVL